MKLRISETFTTIQGEGKFSGHPSLFIRTSGCNLRCHWCDTPYTSWRPEGGMMEVEALCDLIDRTETPDVVITGGEPMLYPEQVKALTEYATEAGRVVTIETNGTVYQSNIRPRLWSVSPKLPSSAPKDGPEKALHEKNNVVDYAAWKVEADYTMAQLKFVLATMEDVIELEKLIATHSIHRRAIWAMPEGITREIILERGAWLAEICKPRGWNLCLRQHVLLYGNRRGT